MDTDLGRHLALTSADPDWIGPYRILSRLGVGGMGVVYLGEDPDGQRAAVKVVRPELANQTQFRTRFEREVRAARLVRGSFCAGVVRADTHGLKQWVASEYVPGPTLPDLVERRGALPYEQLLQLGRDLAAALVSIHDVAVVHRDLKPSNIIVSDAGAKLVDFGIAAASDATSLTQTGTQLGSLAWMAPEQLTDSTVDPRSDIYAWGLVMAFAALGRHPFGSGRAEALAFRVLHDSPQLDDVPPGVRPLIQDTLARDPSLRPSARAVCRRLDEIRAPQPRPKGTHPLRRARLEPVAEVQATRTEPSAPSKEPGASQPRRAAGSRTTGRRVPWLLIVIIGIWGARAIVPAILDEVASVTVQPSGPTAAASDRETASSSQAQQQPDAISRERDEEPVTSKPTAEELMILATAALPALRNVNAGHAFSSVVQGPDTPIALSFVGNEIHGWTWSSGGEWRGRKLGWIDGVRYRAAQPIEVTGDNWPDFVVDGVSTTGDPTATVIVVGSTPQIRWAELVAVDGQTYGASAFMQWDGTQLSSDYGRQGQVSSGQGYQRTYWSYEPNADTPRFVERPL